MMPKRFILVAFQYIQFNSALVFMPMPTQMTTHRERTVIGDLKSKRYQDVSGSSGGGRHGVPELCVTVCDRTQPEAQKVPATRDLNVTVTE
eukprot:2410007-Rhodomonas_salina.1